MFHLSIKGCWKTRPHRSYCFLSMLKLHCKRHYRNLATYSWCTTWREHVTKTAPARRRHSSCQTPSKRQTDKETRPFVSVPVCPFVSYRWSTVWHRVIFCTAGYSARRHTYSRAKLRQGGTFLQLQYRVAQKSKPLSNDQKLVLNRIKACQWY